MTGRVIFRSFQDLGRVFAKLCIGAVLHLQNEHTKNKLYVAPSNFLWSIFNYFGPKMDVTSLLKHSCYYPPNILMFSHNRLLKSV